MILILILITRKAISRQKLYLSLIAQAKLIRSGWALKIMTPTAKTNLCQYLVTTQILPTKHLLEDSFYRKKYGVF